MQWECGESKDCVVPLDRMGHPSGELASCFHPKSCTCRDSSSWNEIFISYIEGTEAQCLKKHQKCSGVPVATPQRTTPLLNLSLSNVVLFKCFESVILLRIFSPFPTSLLPSLDLFASKREAEFRHEQPTTSQAKSLPGSSLGSMASFSKATRNQAMGRGTPVLIYC